MYLNPLLAMCGLVLSICGLVYILKPDLFIDSIWRRFGFLQRRLSEKGYLAYMRGLGIALLVGGILAMAFGAGAAAFFLMGERLAMRKSYKTALTALDLSLLIEDELVPPWRVKAACLCGLARYEECAEAYSEALRIEPDEWRDWLRRGAALEKTAREEEALAAYEKVIELDPRNTRAWMAKGNLLVKMGNEEEGRACLGKAVRLDPGSDPHLAKLFEEVMNRAWEHYESGKYERARKMWLRMAQYRNAEAQYNLGSMYQSGKGVAPDFKEAYRWYLRAARQGDPGASKKIEELRGRLPPDFIREAERAAQGGPGATAVSVQ